MTSTITLSLLLFCALFAHNTQAQRNAKQGIDERAVALEEVKRLSSDIQSLKLDVIDLNKDLLNLEEDLLYPSSTKYSIFVSMKGSQFFTLEAVKLKLDGKFVTTQLYDAADRAALSRGGIHKLFVTNLSEGQHTATVFFTGLGPNATPFKRAAELEFKKRKGQGFLEIEISDNGAIQEPEFTITQW